MAELCHPLWGDFRRSVSRAGLLGCMLKATSCSNYGHGPYSSGKRFISIQQSAKKIIGLAPPEYYESLSEKVFFDRNWTTGGKALTKEEFMSTKVVSRRLPIESCWPFNGIMDFFIFFPQRFCPSCQLDKYYTSPN